MGGNRRLLTTGTQLRSLLCLVSALILLNKCSFCSPFSTKFFKNFIPFLGEELMMLFKMALYIVLKCCALKYKKAVMASRMVAAGGCQHLGGRLGVGQNCCLIDTQCQFGKIKKF